MFGHHARRHGFGAPFGQAFAHGRGRRGGGRGRGEMKYEVLEVLLEGPRHGYEIMLAIENKRGLRPSPGSIYPALQMLEDGDFVSGRDRDGKRTYEITDKGRQLLQERQPEDREYDENNLYGIIGEAMRQVHGIKDAVKGIAKTGDIESFRKAVEVLDRARRELFAILADHV